MNQCVDRGKVGCEGPKVLKKQRKRRTKKKKGLFAGTKVPLRDTSAKNSRDVYYIRDFADFFLKNGRF